MKKIALVTGASRGIGFETARRLSESFYVVGGATKQEGVDRVNEALGSLGEGIIIKVDEDDSVKNAFEYLEGKKLLPSVVVNNAGITSDNLLVRMKPNEWDSVINTNLNGLYRIVRPCLRKMMKERWGRIINISSVVASTGNAGQVNYVASKAAIEGFTRSLAIELASRGITVNAVAPGFIQTDMTSRLSDQQQEDLIENVPIGEMGKPSDIGEAVAFFASDGAGYITGETLHINGGLYMS